MAEKHPPNPWGGKYAKDPDEERMWRLAGSVRSDREWYDATLEHDGIGLCGGCGIDTCHDGPCGMYRHRDYEHVFCDKCERRMAQGVIPPWTTSA